jgi:hypothetical protein
MGSYEILEMTRKFVCPGRRLDVGSGTAALFWILATGSDVRTTASDIEPEALAVLREFLCSPAPLPFCYYQAAVLFGVPAARVELLRQSIDSYLVFNALDTWPGKLFEQTLGVCAPDHVSYALGIVGKPGSDEQEVGKPIQVGGDCGFHSLRPVQGSDSSLGSSARASCDV